MIRQWHDMTELMEIVYQSQESSDNDGCESEENVRHPGRQAVLLSDGGVEVSQDHRHLKDRNKF